MKKKLLALTSCIAVACAATAQVIQADDFDSYTAGNQLAATSPMWITWTGAPTEDAPVSNAQSSSAPNSVYIIGNNGPADIVFQFPTTYTSGVYELTLKIFMAANKGGYFNMQGNTTPAIEWMLEVYFDNVGGGYIHAGGPNAASFTYNTGQWNEVKVKADLTGDEAEFYINNILVYTWAWSLASDGAGAPVSWGGMNLFAAAATPGDAEYYVDDVVFSNVTPTGTSELTLTAVGVFPNPATENFELVYTSDNNVKGTLQLLNALGEIIYEEPKEFTSGQNKIQVGQIQASGIYFLRLLTGKKIYSEKIVVKK